MGATIESVKSQVKQSIEALKRGDLTEERLNRILEALEMLNQKRQDLLYLQAGSTSVNAGVHGMLLIQNGEVIEPNLDESPYKTVLHAIRDGWRIIKFPEMALLMDESRTYGLGCEFILEKWR